MFAPAFLLDVRPGQVHLSEGLLETYWLIVNVNLHLLQVDEIRRFEL